MVDIFPKEKRSEIMSRIRSKNTQVELAVFRFLRKEGIYFQKHYKRVPGCPDISLPRKKRAVFIDGDFWHGRFYLKELRSEYSDFWKKKIEGNIARDKKQRQHLKNMGWKILTVWEGDLKVKKTREKRLSKIKDFLNEK